MTTIDQRVDRITYEFGTVEVEQGDEGPDKRIKLRLKMYPFHDQLPVFIDALGETYSDALDVLERKIHAAVSSILP